MVRRGLEPEGLDPASYYLRKTDRLANHVLRAEAACARIVWSRWLKLPKIQLSNRLLPMVHPQISMFQAAAPVARSCPASSLPCIKWNMATSRREMPGSVALSAASNTTASKLATSRI